MYKISAISYLNTAPFAYGLKHSPVNKKIKLLYDYPAECARKLLKNEADLSLLPVGALNDFDSYHIVSNFCIGSVGPVRSVTLISNNKLNDIRKIYLDYQSRTSVLLVKILCKRVWKISPEFVSLKPTDNYKSLEKNEAILLIGDRVFEAEKYYSNIIDLSEEWYNYYKLPFVFAVWVSKRKLSDEFIKELNNGLELGVNSIESAVDEFNQLVISRSEAIEYLKHNISYRLDEEKLKAIELFQELSNTIDL
ncbi:MAG: chorismate dehydratase [Tenuifilum sp.]|jgi:chorismate dehydratase|uniref:menaquinone biosynthetic enzyme MqnA/MqnD family protein n=1 Tax=Tenuifilum sp. TaxID=2760880 RepID=UPI0024AB3BF3|nr:menaquinone biosynthesis protein [Tenuifilum sp.]MDI3526642.1 chorismate dehydratase [Tenuifilum sp.]